MAYESRKDVASKTEWEGDIMAALDYGLKAEDMPEGDTELREAWAALQAKYAELKPFIDRVGGLLPEAP